ncbi:MAG: YbjQ family protein [Planctomycetes bacterium]|nr:YbjQ family protein [Planctomycetota bacterium]
MISAYLSILIPLGLLILGWTVGAFQERKHYKRLDQREAENYHVPATTERQLWDQNKQIAETRMVRGQVVISVDYFKRFLAALLMLFGGEVHSYSSLLDRGRREALLRMRDQFPNADAFLNLRFETSTISSGSGKSIGTVEVLAYGTGIRYEQARA